MASSINASTSGAGGVITTADNTGILNLQTASTTAVTIDTSQNVGIGTASPSVRLHLKGSSFSNAIRWEETGGNNNFYAGPFDTSGNFGLDNNSTSGYTRFVTNSTERMRIDSSGNVLVATTSILTPGGIPGVANILNPINNGNWALALQNNGTTANCGRLLGMRNATDYNNASNEVWFYIGNNTPRGYFLSNGGLYNFQANNVNLSDRSTKKDITPAKNYLDIICSIPVVTFLYNDQTDNDLNLGVIAQDVEAVAPELITITKLGVDQDTNEEKVLKGIYQTDLQYALMKCIQEQQTIINDLKARVTALEAK
jgi:hypothetical protein